MRSHRSVLSVLGVLCLVAACSSDRDGTSTTATQPSTTQPSTTVPATTVPVVTDPGTTVPATTEPATTVPAGLEQPAIWPAADVVFTTPEEAAADFVTVALGVPATLGEFRQGDSRSGEIEVLLAPEGGTGEPVFRSLLLMRQLGPDNGWFVLASINEFATISVPESGSTVPAAPINVEGVARGFEATIVLEAFVAGSDTLLDQQVFMAGNFDSAEPYLEAIDLTDAAPGDIVVLLVRGSVGLETDPGEFSAIPVVIEG